MPPHTRAIARAEHSRLTPTVLQRRARGVSSTPSPRFGHNISPHLSHPIGSPSWSTQIEEVLDDENEHEQPGNIEYKNYLYRSEHSSEGPPEVPEAEDPPIPQIPPLKAAPPPRATPLPAAPPGTANNQDLLDAILELGRTTWQHRQDGKTAQIREPDPFDGADPKKLKSFIFFM